MAKARNTVNPNQQQLPGVPYVKGSLTSQAAAAAIAPHKTHLESLVFAALVATQGLGATNQEIEGMCGLKQSTANARMRGLVQKGFVKDSGKTRPTQSGCQATVWVLRSPNDPLTIIPKKITVIAKKIVKLLRERANESVPPIHEMLKLADEIEQRGKV